VVSGNACRIRERSPISRIFGLKLVWPIPIA
jgi:hypothetical protein